VSLRRLLILAFILAPRVALADLPAPRLVPELSLSKDKGPDDVRGDPWTDQKRTVSVLGGSPGSPTGLAGLTFEYAPIKYAVLGFGGGWAPDGGARGAFMPRLRLPLNRFFAVSFGTPLSIGSYHFTERVAETCAEVGCPQGYTTTRTWSPAVWGHLEPNLEFRVGPGVALRLYAGVGRVLNRDSDACRSTLMNGCPSDIGEQKIYGGLALGKAW
jgi:hypothetical protein